MGASDKSRINGRAASEWHRFQKQGQLSEGDVLDVIYPWTMISLSVVMMIAGIAVLSQVRWFGMVLLILGVVCVLGFFLGGESFRGWDGRWGSLLILVYMPIALAVSLLTVVAFPLLWLHYKHKRKGQEHEMELIALIDEALKDI